MLLGEYKHNLDTKGRMAVPAKFRDELSSGAIVTRGLDNCLFLFAPKSFELLVNKITSLPLSQSNSRAFGRFMLAGAVDVEIDKQGRILIPDYLRKFANLDKQVVVAGLVGRAEIWNDVRWEEYKKKTESASNEIAERLGEMGI